MRINEKFTLFARNPCILDWMLLIDKFVGYVHYAYLAHKTH